MSTFKQIQTTNTGLRLVISVQVPHDGGNNLALLQIINHGVSVTSFLPFSSSLHHDSLQILLSPSLLIPSILSRK
jgi:hypothetical protein